MKRYDFGPINPADYEAADGKFILFSDFAESIMPKIDRPLSMRQRIGGIISLFPVGHLFTSREIYKALDDAGAFIGYATKKSIRGGLVINGINKFMFRGYLTIERRDHGAAPTVFKVAKILPRQEI